MGALQSQKMFGSGNATPINVLVLDDDRFDRKRIGRWVKSPEAGAIKLSEAADLSQFSKAISQQKFDLIIIDFCLADGDGLDAMDRLVASAQNSSAYVVMISGRDDDAAQREALRYGCDSFLSKSDLSTSHLNDLVRQVSRDRLGVVDDDDRSAIEHWAKRARRRRVIGRTERTSPVANNPNVALITLPRPSYRPEHEACLVTSLLSFLDEDEFVFNRH